MLERSRLLKVSFWLKNSFDKKEIDFFLCRKYESYLQIQPNKPSSNLRKDDDPSLGKTLNA